MRAFILAFSVALLTLAVTSHPKRGSYMPRGQKPDALASSVAVDDTPNPAPFVAQAAIGAAGVPGGVAFVQGCTNEPMQKVKPRGDTLREVLDNITREDPKYVWAVKNGVVDLEPRRGVPALLETSFKTYDSANINDPASAVAFLSSSFEVAHAAAELSLTHNVSGSALGGLSRGPQPPKKPLGVHLRNVTLLEALNAIVRADKHGVWVYREIHCGSVRTYEISVVE